MHNRATILVYAFILSITLHLVLFVPWSTSQKVEKKRQETIPVSFKTIAKKETQPTKPKKATEKPKRAKGLPQPSPPAVKPLPPAPPPPKSAPQPRVAQPSPPVTQKAPPPPPPKPAAKPKVETAKPPPPPPPVVTKLAPAKDAKKPTKEKVVKKKTKPTPKKVKKKPPKPKPKKKVAKKRPQKKTKKKTAAKKTPPRKKAAAPKKPLPTLKELLPPLAGSGRVSGSHGNEYISMDSRDPKYSSWLAALQRDIYRTWLPSYPRANIRGEVLLGIMIAKDGDLDHVEVLRSSGLGLLDRHALESVRAAAPFERFPPWMTRSQQGIKATFTYGGTPGSVMNWSR